MKTKIDELKLFLADIEKEELRLSTIDRSLTSMTDTELALAMRVVQARMKELRGEIEKLEISN